jgi:hypothetical protein
MLPRTSVRFGALSHIFKVFANRLIWVHSCLLRRILLCTKSLAQSRAALRSAKPLLGNSGRYLAVRNSASDCSRPTSVGRVIQPRSAVVGPS